MIMARYSLLTFTFLMMIASAVAQKKTFVLVHAQWHGSWAWVKVTPLLAGAGHKVITFDLPGLGDDTSSIEDVTLDDYVKKVVDISNAENGPVILVGHSSSGIVIAQAGEVLGPRKVEGLVFLDAFLPKNGESVFSLADKYYPTGTPMGKTLLVSSDQKSVSLAPDRVDEFLYHDCSPADRDYARSRLRSGAVSVLAAPAVLTNYNYGRIPKYYILCTQAKDMDKSQLARNVQCEKVFELPSSHSPFFSMPEKLVAILNDIR